MKRQKMMAAAVTVAAATSLAACGSGSGSGSSAQGSCKPAHQFQTMQSGKLTVAGYDLPPFSKLENNKISGVDGDIINAFAQKECLDVVPKWMATAAVIPTVQSGRADVGVGDWYRTTARTQVVNLTDPMYTDQMAFISKDGIKQVSQLKGRNVGTVDGYLWVEDLKNYLGGSLKVYSTTLNMNQDLKAGRIDVGVDSYGSGKYNNPDMKVEVTEPDPAVAASQEPAQAALPVGKKNQALLDALNADIAEMHKNGDIAKFLQKNGLPESAADTGEARLIG
ncbi:MAG: substrate-binding periplasmic protein [Actinomycetes bacterium]